MKHVRLKKRKFLINFWDLKIYTIFLKMPLTLKKYINEAAFLSKSITSIKRLEILSTKGHAQVITNTIVNLIVQKTWRRQRRQLFYRVGDCNLVKNLF